MTLLAPLALLALLPWAGLAWWLMRARADVMRVPFVTLWPRSPTLAAVSRRRRPPPAFVVAALASLLLAILAAARPAVWAVGGESDLTVLVDRGATMSAGKIETRLQRLAIDSPDLVRALDGAAVEVRFVPHTVDDRRVQVGDVVSGLRATTPTAADTADALRSAARTVLADGRRVLLISDQPLGIANPRLFQLGPAEPVPNAAVESVAVDEGKALVTIRNNGPAAAAELRVEAGDVVLVQTITLADDGQPLPVVVDVPVSADGVVVRLRVPDDAWAGDDVLAVARTRAWPRVVAEPTVSPTVRRMLEVFSELRPPRPHARRIVVGPSADTTVTLANPSRLTKGEWAITDHPVVAGVDWAGLSNVVAADDLPTSDAGWRAVVQRGEHVLIAVREPNTGESGRRVWIGFAADGFEQTPEFVRFWADLLTWVNGGPEAWSAQAVSAAELGSRPLHESLALAGLRESVRGPVALNLPRPVFRTVSWSQAELDEWLVAARRPTSLAPSLLVGSMLSAATAAFLWPRGR